MSVRILFLLVCGVGALNSAFLVAYAWFHPRGRLALDRLFALLLATYSARVSKAAWVFFVGEVHPVFEVAWMALFAAGGVVFLAYVTRLTGDTRVFARRVVPGVLAAAIAALFFLGLRAHPGWQLFGVALVVDGVAVALGVRLVMGWSRRAAGADRLVARWLATLAALMSGTWLLFAALPIAAHARVAGEDAFFYAEAVVFSLATYAFLFLELRTGLLFRLHAVRPAADANHPALQRLRELMEEGRAYLDPSLSLHAVARAVKLTPQQLSRVINTTLGVGFNDYVNRFRVEEAARVLSAPEGDRVKIGSLVYDCGFNSPSVFYAAFRRFTGKTPSQYLKDAASRAAHS